MAGKSREFGGPYNDSDVPKKSLRFRTNDSLLGLAHYVVSYQSWPITDLLGFHQASPLTNQHVVKVNLPMYPGWVYTEEYWIIVVFFRGVYMDNYKFLKMYK